MRDEKRKEGVRGLSDTLGTKGTVLAEKMKKRLMEELIGPESGLGGLLQSMLTREKSEKSGRKLRKG